VKVAQLCLALCLALPVSCAYAADVGIFTIVEGTARVLRDTTWYKLVPGARFREGDILVATVSGQIQVELFAGGAFNLGAPGTLFVAAVPMAGDKLTGLVDMSLEGGWLKLAANAAPAGVRMKLDPVSFSATEAVVVMHATRGAMELYVESGAARLTDSETGKSKSPAATDLKAGDFASQSSERPRTLERRAPPAFVAAIPRHLTDALPALAAKYKAVKVQLVPEQEVTYAEAEPWLSGPYRKLFLKRFQSRLKDREFRAGVEARIARYPEWDRILHPEKYLPKVPVETK
jgi:hypothetical protein